MTEQIKKLESEKQTLLTRVDKINKAIKAFQEVCEHLHEDGSTALEYLGHDSHKDHYKCSICNKGIVY